MQNNTWLAAQEDVFDNFYDVRTAKSTFFAENAPFFVLKKIRPCHFRCFMQSNGKNRIEIGQQFPEL